MESARVRRQAAQSGSVAELHHQHTVEQLCELSQPHKQLKYKTNPLTGQGNRTGNVSEKRTRTTPADPTYSSRVVGTIVH